MKQFIKVFMLVLMLVFSSLLTTGTQTIKTTHSGVDAPEWSVGDAWVYNINTEFYYYNILDLKITLTNVTFEVEEIDDKNQEYHLAIGGNIDATGTYKTQLGIDLSGGMSKGSISSGTVSVRKSDLAVLALEDLSADGDAKIGPINTGIDVTAFASIRELTPINYLKFPLDEGDTWTRSAVSGNLSLSVAVGSFMDESPPPFNIYQPAANLNAVGKEDVTLNIGETQTKFECYKIVSDIENTENEALTLWYSPEVGNIVKAEMYDFYLFYHPEVEEHYNISKVTITLTGFTKASDPPNKPAAPSGPPSGKVLESYTFTASTTDPDGDKIFYIFDWGDETQDKTEESVDSGGTASASHKWSSSGKYEVRVKARDTNGAESDWSDPSYIDIEGEVGSVNLTVYIYRIKELEEIDPWTSAEWSYRLSVYDGKGWITRQYEADSGDDIRPRQTYVFPVQTGEPKIKIKLWERDPVVPILGNTLLGPDLADVSAHFGDGINNDIKVDLRGAIYHGIYQIKNHKLSTVFNENNDDWSYEGEYAVTSGRDDGSVADDVDSNDAKIWFTITDDYQPMSNLRITSPEGTTYYTGQKINFEAKVDDGMAPFTWLWTFGDNPETTSNKQSTTKSYAEVGDYNVKVTVTDLAGATIEKTKKITIKQNTAPDKPDRPQGSQGCQVGKTYEYRIYVQDAEHHKVAFAWEWNGDDEIDEFDDNGGEYYDSWEERYKSHEWTESGSKGLRYKAIDVCGDESEWSEALPIVVKSRTINLKSLIIQFLEDHPHIFPILQRIIKLYI